MKNIVINISDLYLKGSILDVTLSGYSVISKLVDSFNEVAVSKDIVEKDYIEWKYGKDLDINEKYDIALAFFSFSSVMGKGKLRHTIMEIKKVLNDCGKIYIWDYYGKSKFPMGKYNIRTILPNGKADDMETRFKINPFRVKYEEMLKIFTDLGFSIENTRTFSDYYYIQVTK